MSLELVVFLMMAGKALVLLVIPMVVLLLVRIPVFWSFVTSGAVVSLVLFDRLAPFHVAVSIYIMMIVAIIVMLRVRSLGR